MLDNLELNRVDRGVCLHEVALSNQSGTAFMRFGTDSTIRHSAAATGSTVRHSAASTGSTVWPSARTAQATALSRLRAYRQGGGASRRYAAAHQALSTERIGTGNAIRFAPPESAVRADSLDTRVITCSLQLVACSL